MLSYRGLLSVILFIVISLLLVACNESKVIDKVDGHDKVGEFVDLSKLSGDLLYSAVVNLYQDQVDKEGSRVRVSGYYMGKDSDGIHYISISDAQACCSIYVLFVSDQKFDDSDNLIVEGTVECFDRGDGAEFKLINTTVERL